jgi:two-component system alkaline phosphatase synthesis response regulator PhoP
MVKKYRVLVVDDDQDIVDLLKYVLEKDGFKVRTEVDSERALKTASRFRPDLIILDIMMDGINGIDLCKELRSRPQFKDTYIFFLTANSERDVQETAIETGGDDLIEKVLGLRELSVKIKAVLLDKWCIHKYKSFIHIGDLQIDRKTGEVYTGNHKVVLSKPEFDLLYFFAQNPRKRIHSKQLLESLWGSHFFSVAHSLNSYLTNLSKKMGHRLKEIEEDTYVLLPGKRLGDQPSTTA